MGLSESIAKAIAGDEDAAVIKSGTLAVTRGAGVVAAAVIAAAQLEWPFPDLTSLQKLSAALVSVGIWSFLAAADAIARGYATAHARPTTTAFPTPLKIRIPAEPAANEAGWKAFLVRTGPAADDVDYWVVKGDAAKWVKASEIVFG